MDTQLKKGVLELAILYQLREGEEYGYEIMKRIREEFPDVYEGSVYAILRRLAAEGVAAVSRRPSGMGPPRKYYSLTPSAARRSPPPWPNGRLFGRASPALGLP